MWKKALNYFEHHSLHPQNTKWVSSITVYYILTWYCLYCTECQEQGLNLRGWVSKLNKGLSSNVLALNFGRSQFLTLAQWMVVASNTAIELVIALFIIIHEVGMWYLLISNWQKRHGHLRHWEKKNTALRVFSRWPIITGYTIDRRKYSWTKFFNSNCSVFEAAITRASSS